MTEKVLKFERKTKGGWYTSRQMGLCGHIVLEYFDVDDEFDLHFSTDEPTDDDECYVLESGVLKRNESDECWYLVDGPDKGTTPTTTEMDAWLTKHFAGKRVYAWAVG